MDESPAPMAEAFVSEDEPLRSVDTPTLDPTPCANGAGGFHARGIMRNGKPRPSAIRDFPDVVSLKENKEAADYNDLQNGERKQRGFPEANGASKQAVSGQSKVSMAKPAGVRDLPDVKKPAGVRDLPEIKKPTGIRDLVEVKKPAGIRDLVEVKIPAVARDLPETPKVNLEKRGRDSEPDPDEGSGVKKAVRKESEIVDSVKGNSSEKKTPEASRRKTPQSKPSSVDQALSKRKKPNVDPKASPQEQNETPKVSRRKSTSSTPTESAKRANRSSGKKGKPAAETMPVREALRLFDAARRRLSREDDKNGKASKGRPDLVVLSTMKEKGLGQGVKIKGSIPGVEVGDAFFFRTELSFVKIHAPPQGGIEYLTAKETEWNTPVAINIISVVGQDDANDTGHELIYAGQGGKSVDNKQVDDQKLERGNLAMDGSKRYNVPVRVIRGIKDTNSYSGKIYLYDGLYTVVESYTVKGSGGFDEFRFKLQRIPGQPPLGSHLVVEANNLKKESPAARKDVVVRDIAKGKESQPICVANTVDADKGPAAFEYSTEVVYPDDIEIQKATDGCSCKGVCGFSSSCSCFIQNGDDLPYITGGLLVKEKNVVFECSSQCSCSSTCRNRGHQKVGRFRLEVFKTENKGWGLRSLETIPAGNFVCEYIGKVVADLESMEAVCGKEHVLDVRRLFNEPPRWGEASIIYPDETLESEMQKPNFVLDASHTGNVARFINHSCSPNLLVQKVLSEFQDERFPQMKFFAMDHIPPMRELTFNYGTPVSEEHIKSCFCGSSDCRGTM